MSAVVSTGKTAVPRSPPAVPSDVVYSTVTGVVGSTKIQNGSNTGTTDANGGLKITFPVAFPAAPTTVVATVNGAAGVNGPDYTCRLSGKKATDFTVKVLQGGVNWTSGAVLGSGLTLSTATAITSVPTSGGNVRGVGSDWHNDFAATTSGGVAGDPFLAIESTGVGTFLTSINATADAFVKSGGIATNSGVAVVSVSGFLTAAANVSVKIDWIAAA